ncbi:hypothetical protein NEOLEDRAFT_1180857 [Neolentinus lepideus HHB14362 ss-1]|uniref:Peptide hydrolase n=1 Tax=Neolentinus lepideus HHB14362 ss-1 TaxID=1314782 RepID=A0A165QHQ4_9AGAM|nr:hypothetical protein NEOLEDRAFT_1180857 [Neolentinus lepideus HHB14362 ss-1]
MAIKDYALAFRTVPTTVLAVLIYAVLFLAVSITDDVPSIPNNLHGLNLTLADVDLHLITLRPHPYLSHFNDAVRSYLLARVRAAAAKHPGYVHVADDTAAAAWATKASPHAVYFQSTNILVKIDGTDPSYVDKDAVLFSAHYDSVSTAGGVTDDGIGVVALLAMVDFLAGNRPRKTAVFNINNGEEDGLHGAHAFLEHPYANITTAFLNLEGAGAGGRPILFRTTSLPHLPLPHPHANALAADAYSLALLRSSTDFSVYQAAGLEGGDLAFYKGRSRYHTRWDAVPTTEGGRRALWAMMEAVRGAGLALLNDGVGARVGKSGRGGRAVGKSGGGDRAVGKSKGGDRAVGKSGGGDRAASKSGGGDRPVYFDLLGSRLVLFTLRAEVVADVALLVVGPVVLGALMYRKRGVLGLMHYKRRGAGVRGWGWGRFPFALLVSFIAQVGLVAGYVGVNPFIIHSCPLTVLASTTALVYLCLSLLLSSHFTRLPFPRPLSLFRHVPPATQKLAVTLEVYVLTWIFLLVAAVGSRWVAATYWVTALNGAALVGCVVGLVGFVGKGEGKEGVGGGLGEDREGEEGLGEDREGHAGLGEDREGHAGLGEGRERRYVNGIRYEVGGEEEEDEVPTEITPLLGRADEDHKEEIGWWAAQLLLTAPLPVVLLLQIAFLVVHALGQGLVDGGEAWIVYAATASLSLLTLLPLAPFMHKMHKSITVIAAAVFVATTLYAWTAFPFTRAAPFKVFFQQGIELGGGGHGAVATTSLTGAPYYLQKVIAELPSAYGKHVSCSASGDLTQCKWDTSDLMPVPSANSEGFLVFNATRLNESSAEMRVRGVNTRGCRLYFDNKPVRYVHVWEGGEKRTEMQRGYEVSERGLVDVRLWSREWEEEFRVEVGWDEDGGGGLEGRVACEWAEYASGTAGTGVADGGASMPALEEALAFLPDWAVLTNANDGLVEAWERFAV